MHKPTYKAAIFDFDGTLVNTIDDLANAANYTMRHFGFPEHPVEKYKHMVGNGIVNLMHRAAGEGRDEMLMEEVIAFYRNYYHVHSTEMSQPYSGVSALLSALLERGIKIAVLSNKPNDATRALTANFFPNISFTAVAGASEQIPIKPDPAGVHEILSKFGISAEACLFLGDSDVDMRTAKNAACDACGVLWGFRGGDELLEAGADYLVQSPMDVLDLF